MKRPNLFNRQLGGFYVMSTLIGVWLAMTIVLSVEVAALSNLYYAASVRHLQITEIPWIFFPLSIFGDPTLSLPILSVIMLAFTIITIFLFGKLVTSGHYRTKATHCLATAFLTLLLIMAFSYALHDDDINPIGAVVPALFAAIPVWILGKTQLPLKGADRPLRDHAEPDDPADD